MSQLNQNAVTDPAGVRIEFARLRLATNEAMHLDVGSVIELDAAGEEVVEIYADGRLVARGEAIDVGGRMGVRINEVIARSIGQT